MPKIELEREDAENMLKQLEKAEFRYGIDHDECFGCWNVRHGGHDSTCGYAKAIADLRKALGKDKEEVNAEKRQ